MKKTIKQEYKTICLRLTMEEYEKLRELSYKYRVPHVRVIRDGIALFEKRAALIDEALKAKLFED